MAVQQVGYRLGAMVFTEMIRLRASVGRFSPKGRLLIKRRQLCSPRALTVCVVRVIAAIGGIGIVHDRAEDVGPDGFQATYSSS